MIHALRKSALAAGVASAFVAGTANADINLGTFDMSAPFPYFVNISSPPILGPDTQFDFFYTFDIINVNASNGTSVTASAIDGNGLASLELKLISPADLVLVDVMATESQTTPGTWNASFNYSPILAGTGTYKLEILGKSTSTSLAAGYNGNMILAAVPEPESYAMLMAGLGLLGFVSRRKKKQETAA